MKKNLNYFYLKGLGSWTKSRLNQVIEKEGGMENLLLHYEADKDYKQAIQNWFGADSEPRKKALRGRQFHINKALLKDKYSLLRKNSHLRLCSSKTKDK